MLSQRAKATATLALIFVLGIAAGTSITYSYYQANHSSPAESTITSQVKTTITQTTTQTTTRTSTVYPAAAISKTSKNGLQLFLSLNSSTIQVGQGLEVNAVLVNTRTTLNVVNSANSWAFRGIPIATWPVCDTVLPFEFLILKGNYSIDQLRSSANLTLQYQCAEGWQVNTVEFQPGSYTANLSATYLVTYTNETIGPFGVEAHFGVTGYWDPINQTEASQFPSPLLAPRQGANATGFQYPEHFFLAQHHFGEGMYTLALVDEWGDALALQFVVV